MKLYPPLHKALGLGFRAVRGQYRATLQRVRSHVYNTYMYVTANKLYMYMCIHIVLITDNGDSCLHACNVLL